MNLWLLRHAVVQLEAGLCYGATDVPAQPPATREAARLLAPLLPQGASLWSSGLMRARQLASGLQRARPDLRRQPHDPRLNEINFGIWELQRWDSVPRSAYDDWMTDFAHHRFGGAESTQELIDRVGAAMVDLGKSGVRDAVWVTHAGVIRAVEYLSTHGLTPIREVGQWPKDAPEPGGYVCVRLEP